jgi:hypothetical protein
MCSSTTGPTRRDRKRPAFAFLLAASLSSSCATVTAQQPEYWNFEPHEIVLDTAPRQTVLTGFLLGGAVADLAALSVGDNEEPRLSIYAFDGQTWVRRLDRTLGAGVSFVDIASIDGRDRLVTYEAGRLHWFDPQSAREHVLTAVTSNFRPPRADEVPHVDITQDVNGDDRDDLVVRDVDGFWVFIQRSDGLFADAVKVGPPTKLGRILGADGYRYAPWSQSRVHETDYNQDGRRDLVFWNTDHFVVHQQDARGLFTGAAETFTTEVAFDSDLRSWLTSGDMTGRVLHSLTDVSGDGVGDLVVHALEGGSISSKRSTYEAHFGRPAPAGGILFAPDPDIAFQSDRRIHLGMEQLDFDGDGRLDLMFTTIDVKHLEGNLWKRLKGAMGDDINLNLEFYRNEGGRYSDTPNTTRRIALDGAPSHREPGWVSLAIVLRGATDERRQTQDVLIHHPFTLRDGHGRATQPPGPSRTV